MANTEAPDLNVSISYLSAGVDGTTNVNRNQAASLPIRKRKQDALLPNDEQSQLPAEKMAKTDGNGADVVAAANPNPADVPGTAYNTDILRLAKEHAASAVAAAPSAESDLKPIKRDGMPKAREVRLEQNRKAARESRRRKKIMIEELQRSVVFFSRANGTLKQQNDELQRLLLAAQSKVQAFESTNAANVAAAAAAAAANANSAQAPAAQHPSQVGHQQQQNQNVNQFTSNDDLVNKEHRQVQAQEAVASAQAQAQQAAQAAATQAIFQNQGFPPAAARAAAQTFSAGPAPSQSAMPNNTNINQIPNGVVEPTPLAVNTVNEAQLPSPAPIAVNPAAAAQMQMWPLFMQMGAANAQAPAPVGMNSQVQPANVNVNGEATNNVNVNNNMNGNMNAAQAQAPPTAQAVAVQNALLQQLSQQMQQGFANANANNMFQNAFMNQAQQQHPQQQQQPVSVTNNVVATEYNTIDPSTVADN
mmetsp:Transcript_16317/g.23924  ORF Transcript_16317/g.23924 Transcript_16317/m.23924 type:complete len:476 (+) Transcript_16317:216-1643(+)